MMTYKNLVFIFGILAVLVLSSCAGGKNIINKQFLKDEYLKSVASNPDHEVQIIYTSVNKKNKTFTSYTYNVDPSKYFYPASTVKMPVRPNQTPSFVDETTESRQPNIERYIQKLFAVSDNNAYNRLYEFLGQDYINQTLRSKGAFTNSIINHRLSIPNLTPEDNRHTNDIRFRISRCKR